MRRSLLALSLLLVGAAAVEVAMLQDPVDEVDEGMNKAACWRIKSLVRSNGPRQGFEWSVTKVELYSSVDGSGTPIELVSITASTTKGSDGLEATNFDADKMTDGSDDTRWQAAGMDRGEYFTAELAQPAEVKSFKLMQASEEQAVKQFVLEKSQNCQVFARVAEFVDVKDSYGKEALFTFEPVDRIPSGVFQLRSRVDLNLCIGIMPSESEALDMQMGRPQKTCVPGQALQVQMCNVDVLAQFWFFDSQKRLVSACNNAAVLTLDLDEAGKLPSQGSKATLQTCAEGCPDINSGFAYNDEGLLMHTLTQVNMVLAPVGGALEEGTQIAATPCGAQEDQEAEMAVCDSMSFAQWDVPPMFTIESNKQADNCAPYSHSNVQPETGVTSQKAAQTMCAKDPKCKVYMYANNQAEAAWDQNKVWLCSRLNDVYAGKPGYELGLKVDGN